MKQLSDLLREAKADAPPMRYDVGDVVALGRRRRNRRTATWAVAVAVVVATAGVALVVPRGPAAVPTPPVASPTSVAPSATGPFYNYSFRGFTVPGYRVTPSRLTLDSSLATVFKAGSSGLEQEAQASVEAYRPGVEPRIEGTVTETEPINGHRAFWNDDLLYWEYAEGLLASVGGKVSRAELRTLATAFVPGRGQPSRVAMKVGYLPAGYRLVTVSESFSGSYVELVPEAGVRTMASRPGENLTTMTIPGELAIAVTIPRDGLPNPAKLTCADKGGCRVAVGGGYRLSVNGEGMTTAELKKIARAVVAVTDPGKASTWLDADEAFPTSALLTGIK
ncbi:hypothetical protein Acy02nite_64880 [Actinoplanes cyaneus]|uniref:Uncharacterized protein n=1 Tax=Actinoplanes cyaneus TaxID=52696 RepID=A0A919INR6_9ACTN|nr:hypothetical protein [Actinoplanes cyaneus]MCW2141788.1 hypothetical protein [Actinoplanes cyaneus]GID68607.1 hypothetical protein Acy02nite_64880 [Actinoplanes cyaneus]